MKVRKSVQKISRKRIPRNVRQKGGQNMQRGLQFSNPLDLIYLVIIPSDGSDLSVEGIRVDAWCRQWARKLKSFMQVSSLGAIMPQPGIP